MYCKGDPGTDPICHTKDCGGNPDGDVTENGDVAEMRALGMIP